MPRTCAPGWGACAGSQMMPSRGAPFAPSPLGWEGLPGEGAAGVEAQSLVPGIPEGLAELGREQGWSGVCSSGMAGPQGASGASESFRTG